MLRKTVIFRMKLLNITRVACTGLFESLWNASGKALMIVIFLFFKKKLTHCMVFAFIIYQMQKQVSAREKNRMKKWGKAIKDIAGKLFTALCFVFVLISATTGAAKDLKCETGADAFINANILYAAAKIDSDRFSISYDGLSGNEKETVQSRKNTRGLEVENKMDLLFETAQKEDLSFKVAQRLKGAVEYVLQYIKIGDFSVDDRDTALSIKSKVKTDKMEKEDFDFNVSLAIGSDDNSIINMEAVNFESYWNHTYVNAAYHCEKNQIEFGLSNSYINKQLLNGMKLELQTIPNAKTGMILLTKSL